MTNMTEEPSDYYEDQDAMMAGDTCVECESLIDDDGDCQCEEPASPVLANRPHEMDSNA